MVGLDDGLNVGKEVGLELGRNVGEEDGINEGEADGPLEGFSLRSAFVTTSITVDKSMACDGIKMHQKATLKR